MEELRREISESTPTSSLDELRILYLNSLINTCNIPDYTRFMGQMRKVGCGPWDNPKVFTGACNGLPRGLMATQCRNHDIVALKTIRIQDIYLLSKVTNIFHHNLKVIHLLRDPRAVINSRSKFPEFYLKDLHGIPVEPMTTERIELVAHDYCDRETKNMVNVDWNPGWLQGKYLRLTHREVSLVPVETLDRIYSFLSLKVPENVRSWAENLLKIKTSQSDFLSTVKNSTEVVDKWKKEMEPKMVGTIERVCADMMAKLNLKT